MKSRPHRDARRHIVLAAAVLLPLAVHAQARDARAIITAAAATELNSDRNDHTAYIYQDHDIVDGKDTLFHVCETPEGNLKRKLEDHGHPLSPADRAADDAAMQKFVHDEALKRKQRHDNSHDDAQAEEMLKLLPSAFLWTIVSEQGDLVTMDFKPDPAFDPQNMEARVFASMEGRVVVAKGDNRIRSMSGRMTSDVKILGGMLGSLHKGGTFQVERREVVPHHWQVTELHVHIQGKVFFATIGSQEDETRTDFKPSPAENLQQAYDILTK
jgi:hypothetical protein